MKLNYPFDINRASVEYPGLIYWLPGAAGTAGGSNILRPSPLPYFGTPLSTGFWQPGFQGGKASIFFDKTQTNRLKLLDGVNYFTNGASASCWIHSTDTGYNYLIQKWGAPNGTDTFHLRFDASTGFAYWTVSTNGNYQSANELNSSIVVNDGNWHLITGTYDNVTSRLYVDGKLQASVAVGGALFDSGSEVWFGALSDGSVIANWFTGLGEDIKVWNRGLPGKTVQAMYDQATRWNLRRRPNTVRTPVHLTNTINASASNTITYSQTAIGHQAILQETPSNHLTINQAVSRGQALLFVTSGTTFTAPSDWPGTADLVECIGGGSGGRSAGANVGPGGAGGAYASQSNVTIANGDPLLIGSGGGPDTDGGDTYLGTSLAGSVVGAQGARGTTGGQASASVGTTKFDGGDGGGLGINNFDGGGGGGAAGPHGDGGNGGVGGGTSAGAGGGGNGGGTDGVGSSGGTAGSGGASWDGTPGGTATVSDASNKNGSNGSGGAGGVAVDGSAGSGGNGDDWDSTHGSGGGGGGGDINTMIGGNGGDAGLYGGGGGGEPWPHGTAGSHAGTGAQGIIVITYTPTSSSVINASASNTITYTQAAVNVGAVSNIITFSQTCRGFSGTKLLSESLVFTENVARALVLGRSVTTTFSPFTVASASQIRPASNTLTFSESATTTVGKGASNTLVLTQSVTYNYTPHNASAANLLTFSQSALGPRVLPRTAANTLTFAETAIGIKVHQLTVSQVFVIAQDFSLVPVQAPHQILTFDGEVTATKVLIKAGSSLIAFSQTVAAQKTLNLSITDQLIFQAIYNRPTNIGGVLQTVPIPNVIVTKVVNAVTLRTGSRAIVMRNPLIGDSVGTMGTMVLQRTITGGTYTYARRATSRKLRWSFETDRNKGVELRRFLLDYLSDPIWLTDWKGQLWIGYITNNPFELTVHDRWGPKVDGYTFSFEFEGERLH